MNHRRRPWLLYLGAAAAVLPCLIAAVHVPRPVWAAGAAIVVTLARVYLAVSGHVWDVLAAAVLAVAARGTWALVKFTRLPRAAKRHYPLALWSRFRWRWMVKALGLAWVDQAQHAVRPVVFGTAAPMPAARPPRTRLRFPRARFRPTPYGIDVKVRAIPKAGREEFDEQAGQVANAWKCVRVSVSQPAPGMVLLRGLRRDPLLEPLEVVALPAFDGRRLWLGRDEFGQMRAADLANLSGSAFTGSPGRGKTECALAMAAQLAVSPLVDTWILDGGACDWSGFAGGAAGYVGDDLAAAADMLAELDGRMCLRRRDLRADRGARNGWSAGGPTPDYRLQWLLMEEAPFYLDLDVVKGDRKREEQVRTCRGLLLGLLRRGRAPLFHSMLISQLGTGTGGLPPDLRNLCGIRWTFALATIESSVAILGDQIRQYADTMSPTLLQGPEHVGCACVLLRTGMSPFTLVKFPAVGDGQADRIAADMAGCRAAETAVSDTPVALVGA